MADITEIYMEEVVNIKHVTGVLPSLVYQPISTEMMSHFSKNGGNALGLSEIDGPLNCKYFSPLAVLELIALSNPSRHLMVSRHR